MAALNTTLPKLEAALEAKQFRESRQLLKTAQNQFQALDDRHRKNVQAKMQLLAGQFRELSDWQGFATEPKQVSLCEQMEYLAEQPMEPEAKAERIKELQNEWRELGGSSDRTLWNRFKAASDQAYEPCKAYFEAKADLKQANLHKREAICEELERFLAQADWTSIDWKGAERIHQTARQEWKAAWPVDFRDNRQVQKRFDDLLKNLERPLDEERQKNEAAKQAIVERAQALIDHEPLQEAMDQAKALQSEWKRIGITRHREDRKLWQAFQAEETGYSQMQGTKPQTIGTVLNDSPVGLAAWIVEKFRTWCDCDGDPESVFTKDELLTNITIYWATQTINSSIRIYYESQRAPWQFGRDDGIRVPCAVALFPKDISYPTREWAERSYNVQRWTEMPSGGHFAALEEPEMLVEDMRAFFRTLR